MDYMDWLACEHPPRFVTVEELESGEKEIKPLDYIPISSWHDLKTAAEHKTKLKKSTDNDCERHLDFTFVSCLYNDLENGEGYEGSLVVVTPYVLVNDVGHQDFKDFLVNTCKEIDAIESLYNYMGED